MSEACAEIDEANAPPDIAAIYNDIKRTLKISSVNLIWRHLATKGEELLLAWSLTRPLYVDGIAEQFAELIQPKLNNIKSWRSEEFRSSGLMQRDIVTIRGVLHEYDRTNRMALIAFSTLSAVLTDQPKHPASRTVLKAAPPIKPGSGRQSVKLPYLYSVSELPDHVAKQIYALNRIGERRDAQIVASMYRHLAHWPGFLAMAHDLLAPYQTDAFLPSLIDQLIAESRGYGASLASRLDMAPSVPQTLRLSLDDTIEKFIVSPIGKMAAICTILIAAIRDS